MALCTSAGWACMDESIVCAALGRLAQFEARSGALERL